MNFYRDRARSFQAGSRYTFRARVKNRARRGGKESGKNRGGKKKQVYAECDSSFLPSSRQLEWEEEWSREGKSEKGRVKSARTCHRAAA